MTRSTHGLRGLSLAAVTALVMGLGTAPPATADAGHDHVRDHRVPSTGCDQSPSAAPGTSTTQRIESGGVERTYVLHVPAGYEADEPVPLVLAFHGRKSTGAEIEEFSGLSSLPAVVAYPNGLPVEGKTAWEGAPYSPPVDDVLFTSDLMDELQGSLCVDPDRIYATGKSNGAGFAALLACRMEHRIAAFAPVSGAFYPETEQGCGPGAPVPMLEFHGTDDPIIEYEGGESHGEEFPGAMEWIHRWVSRDRCRSETSRQVGADVTVFSWGHCRGHADVLHYRIDGAGHTWPGELVDSGPGSATQTVSATEEMWGFFTDHPLHGCRTPRTATW